MSPQKLTELNLATGQPVRLVSWRLRASNAERVVNFQQLRIIRETVRRNFNLTEVANALYTSQSGVSKHIKDLEDELGVELFVRRGKRLLGLTEPGKELVGIVERMLLDAKNIKRLAEQFALSDQGELGGDDAHAGPVRSARSRDQFKKAFPKVRLVLHQASPKEIVSHAARRAGRHRRRHRGADETHDVVAFPLLLVGPRRHRSGGHELERQRS